MPSFRRILVPVDESHASTKALVAALELARRGGAQVRAVHVIDGMQHVTGFHYSPVTLDALRIAGNRLLGNAADVCQAAGVPHDTHLVHRNGRRLGEAIADEAAQWSADLVVVGTHARHGPARLMLGSGAEQILRLADVSVLVVRQDAALR